MWMSFLAVATVAFELALHPAVGFAGVYPPEAQHDQRASHELGKASNPAFVVDLLGLPDPRFWFFPDDLLRDCEEPCCFIPEQSADSPPVSLAEAETAHQCIPS